MRSPEGHLTHFIGIGGRGRAIMPSSEVCMHIGVAEKYMDFAVIDGGDGIPFVQLFVTEPGTKRFSQHFSAPISAAEAGLLDTGSKFDEVGPCPFPLYYHPHSLQEQELRDTGKFDSEAGPYNPDYPVET